MVSQYGNLIFNIICLFVYASYAVYMFDFMSEWIHKRFFIHIFLFIVGKIEYFSNNSHPNKQNLKILFSVPIFWILGKNIVLRVDQLGSVWAG